MCDMHTSIVLMFSILIDVYTKIQHTRVPKIDESTLYSSYSVTLYAYDFLFQELRIKKQKTDFFYHTVAPTKRIESPGNKSRFNVLLWMSKLIVSLLLLLESVSSDFVYTDFHETHGLVFNGDAGTTACAFDPLVSEVAIEITVDEYDFLFS